jgi:hypothetical protein
MPKYNPVFRDEHPRPISFIAETMYQPAFSVLRPSGQQRPVNVRAEYNLLPGAVPCIEKISVVANRSWQAISAEIGDCARLALYSDKELKTFGRWTFPDKIAVFGETSIRGKDAVTDEPRLKVGCDGEFGRISGRILASEHRQIELGVSGKVHKDITLGVGAQKNFITEKFAISAGVKFAPCDHFQVSVMNAFDGQTHRPTASVYVEANKKRTLAMIATNDELAVGGNFQLHEKLKLRSYFDLFRMDTRQELNVRITGDSYINFRGAYKQGKFSTQVGVYLVA